MNQTYQDLDINARINLKGALRAWATYSVQHFQGELEKRLYRVRRNRAGVASSSLGRNYAFGRGGRTGALKQQWWKRAQSERVTLEFLNYGRFLDMGVGRGNTNTDRLVASQLREGGTGRKRVPWYAKRKSYEVKRLREILVKMHISVPIDSLESALSMTLTANL